MSGAAGATAGSADRHRRLLGAAAAAFLVLLAVILAVVGGREPREETVARTAQLVDADELTDLEADLGHVVYWLGDRPPARIELALDAGGNVFVRYLPPGVDAGDGAADYPTVGTYPVTDAATATRRFARGAGGRVLAGPDGSVIVPNPASAGSAYLAYPDSDLQIEVFDPRRGRALELIRAEEIRPVGAG